MLPLRRCSLVVLVIAACLAGAQEVAVTARVDWRGGGSKDSPPLPDVVLWLVPVGAPVPRSPSDSARGEHPRLIQRNKSFDPHIVVVPIGSVVEFPNRDPFFHNVFSLFEGKRFDLGLYEAGSTRNVRFDRAGVSYIFCNIHPEMSAIVVAVPTVYYGVSDRRGQIVIPRVPAGRYTLHLWHDGGRPEELSALTRQLEIDDAGASLGVFHLTAVKLPQGHKNKYGKDYDPPAPDSPAYARP
jgi:plastocyanin